jgi:hypothetical protein
VFRRQARHGAGHTYTCACAASFVREMTGAESPDARKRPRGGGFYAGPEILIVYSSSRSNRAPLPVGLAAPPVGQVGMYCVVRSRWVSCRVSFFSCRCMRAVRGRDGRCAISDRAFCRVGRTPGAGRCRC